MTELSDQEYAEFTKGMMEFEKTRPVIEKITRKILYNTLSGAIIAKISDENYTTQDPAFALLDVEQSYFDYTKLKEEYYVSDNRVMRIPGRRVSEIKRLIVPTENGRFTVTKHNMLFVSEQGETYDYRKN